MFGSDANCPHETLSWRIVENVRGDEGDLIEFDEPVAINATVACMECTR
jgi:hypothetical protein